MPLTILSCCKIGGNKLPACYIIVTKMLQESETQTCLQVSQRAQNISQNAKCYNCICNISHNAIILQESEAQASEHRARHDARLYKQNNYCNMLEIVACCNVHAVGTILVAIEIGAPAVQILKAHLHIFAHIVEHIGNNILPATVRFGISLGIAAVGVKGCLAVCGRGKEF